MCALQGASQTSASDRLNTCTSIADGVPSARVLEASTPPCSVSDNMVKSSNDGHEVEDGAYSLRSLNTVTGTTLFS